MLSKKTVVMFSGGLGSWGAARRIRDEDPNGKMVLLFADTLIEDEDLYRFLDDAAKNLSCKVERVADGRTPWQVFFDVRFLGNSRIDPCSRILKRELLRKWLDDNCSPDDTTVVLGFDWTEIHRFERSQRFWQPWTVRAPLCERPYGDKHTLKASAERQGLCAPRLYRLGFPHNNCGGFCIKAGKANFELLFREFPDRYREHEEQEQAIQKHLGQPVTILTDRRGGEMKRLSLRDLRKRLERKPQPSLPIFDDWGGCGCLDVDEEEST